MSWDLPSVPRIVAIGDIHGDIKRLNDALVRLGVINTRLEWVAQPQNTYVIQVGDQIDSKCRDPQCDWEATPDVRVLFFMHHLDRIARQHGGRVISLIGNHEVMNMLGDFSYVSDKSMMAFCNPTVRRMSFKPGGHIAKKYLSHRPVIVKIGSYVFCHAGVTMDHLAVLPNIFKVNDIFRAYSLGEDLQPADGLALVELVFGQTGLVWTRRYVEPFSLAELDTITNTLNCRRVITGHNVVDSITNIADKIMLIDTGMSRAFGGGSFQVLEILDDGAHPDSIRSHTFQYT